MRQEVLSMSPQVAVLAVGVAVVTAFALAAYFRTHISALLFFAIAGCLVAGPLIRTLLGDLTLATLGIVCVGWGYARAFTVDRGLLARWRAGAVTRAQPESAGFSQPLSFARLLVVVGAHFVAALALAYIDPRQGLAALALALLGTEMLIAYFAYFGLRRGADS